MKQTKCIECDALNGEHSPLCSLNTPEQIKEHLRVYFEAYQVRSDWVNTMRQHFNKRLSYYNSQIEPLQGKIAVLKHENNQLRKKLINPK